MTDTAPTKGKVARAIVVGRGRMGTLVRQLLEEASDFSFVASFDATDASALDQNAPTADIVIDFSAPAALPHLAAYIQRTEAALVSGTTGFSEADLNCLRSLGTFVPVVHAANYSIGVTVLRRLVAQAAQTLEGFDVEIVETHHNKKVDAPSGTAKMLLNAIDPEGKDKVVYGRQGLIGARTPREIGMHCLRGGTVAGTHEVHFFGNDEEIILTHRATSRTIFAQGALEAARALLRRPAGFYSLENLLFEKDGR